MYRLELKVPPPVVALCLALFLWVAPSLGRPEMPLQVRVGMALVLVLIGQSISIAGMVAFRRARTTINPIKASAASSLVTTGVYRFTRNPMYLGLLLTLLAWAVFLFNPVALLFVPIFVLYINRFQIKPEEQVLSSLFGAEYMAYKGQVRRWLWGLPPPSGGRPTAGFACGVTPLISTVRMIISHLPMGQETAEARLPSPGFPPQKVQ